MFRAACIGSASEKDSTVIIDFMNIRTLVDLRSEQEWNGDILKYNSTIFDSYDSMFYEVRRSKKNGRPKAVLPLQDPVRYKSLPLHISVLRRQNYPDARLSPSQCQSTQASRIIVVARM